MPPAPGSMSLSSRTAIADGRKKTTIASSHNPRLASPNWLAAVVSQRSPTMALMLNSTTSRSRMTRGSCWLICPRCVQGAVGCTRATSHPTPPPMAAPPTTSVGKCWPAATRSAATAVAPANSSTVLRARWGRCSRRAIARYAVATENAAAAWPDGNERRLSRFEAAAGAADVYSTGRLRCASTLIHWVVASVHASALANTTTWPRTAAALAPSAEASPANPATATSSAWLAVRQPRDEGNHCDRAAGRDAGRIPPGHAVGSLCDGGSHGDDTQRQRHGPTGHAVSVERDGV